MKRTPLAGMIAGLAAGLAVVLFVAYLATSASKTDENADTLQLIKDCTIEPAGKCAELQQQQAAMFSRMIALASACADRRGQQSIAQIERCIRKGMKDERTEQ